MKGLAMKSILAMVVAIAVGAGTYAGTGQGDPPKSEQKQQTATVAEEKKVESPEDPLPAGSTLRFGTSRFRNGTPITSMAVSADGKMAIVADSFRVFNLSSGRALYTVDSLIRTGCDALAISPDGKSIVAKKLTGRFIHDAATGQELRKIDLPAADSFQRNNWLAFTPDNKAVAATSEGTVIHLIDFESGKRIRDFAHDDGDIILAVAFSPDGKLMASGGHYHSEPTAGPFARLWEVETGRELRRLMHGNDKGYGEIRALAFSPDGKTLVGGGQSVCARLWDVGPGKERKAVPLNDDPTMILAVAFAPDGKTVAAASASGSIRLHDAITGDERLRIDRAAIGLQFTDDGKTLTGAVKEAIYRWDTATGKTLTPEAAGDSSVEKIRVDSDGSRVVICGENHEVHLWDAKNGTHLEKLKASWQNGMAMSPDGRLLVSIARAVISDPQNPRMNYPGVRIELYDTAAGKTVNRFPDFKGGAQDITFANDGKKLVSVDHRDGMVRLWNVETGKEERRFEAMPVAKKKQSSYIQRTTISPDGKTLAVACYQDDAALRGLGGLSGPHLVRLWDMATGKEQHQFDGRLSYVFDMAFSPSGRLLVTADDMQWRHRPQVFVWDTTNGNRIAALPDGLPIGASAVAFSRDGRFLATAEPEGTIRVWEVATWTAQNEFKGHRDRPTTLTFMPGGQLLSGSVDTTVLAWDTRPPRIAMGSLETAWIDLARPESSAAFKAEGRFMAEPAVALKFIAEKVKAVEAPDARRIQRLIADLDNTKFAVRESATKTLTGLGERARPYLEEAVKTMKSEEALDRARKILDGMNRLTPEQLRQVRAVLVLELINDDESKNLLKKWAGGSKGALLTEEATAALKRLDGSANAKR